ncbi:MAG: ABC transporter ATP-binding protein [Alphaproteobacteria bacterium]|nr:ABC transporter ATP-binding protein [Alphaproteobacteria bacterium]
MSAAPVLVADGLVKRYGGLVANDTVGMTLAAGEIRGLIGPNGAGKTTFVNLVTGIETPDQGIVRLGDVPITGLSPHRIAERGLVRSFQHARAFPSLTVRENLLVPYMASPATTDAQAGMARAEELMRLSTLTPLADQPAGALSGGQRMLLMACAGFMIPGIRVYVLDEPFAGINPVVKDTLIELILHENKTTGMTFLIVSHEMEIVRRLCPKVTVMIQGRVAAEGTLDEIAQREDVITAYLGRASA